MSILTFGQTMRINPMPAHNFAIKHTISLTQSKNSDVQSVGIYFHWEDPCSLPITKTLK